MFKAREATLRQLFDSGEYDQFSIPAYQRSYVWGQDELDNFWNDFVIRQEGQGQLHLMGSFIISKSKDDPKKYGVVDGQQRMITSSLLIAAVRDVWGERFGYANDDYHNIDRFVVKKDRSKGTVLKVKVASSLSEVMDSILVLKQIPDTKLRNVDEKALISAYKYFIYQLEKIIDKPSISDEYRKDLLWSKIDNLFDSNVIVVILEDEDDAHEVFEGFNARGVDLSIADLFKNLIIQKVKGSPSTKEESLNKWTEINQIVKDINVPKFNINTLLRYFWIRDHHYIGEKELYRRIKKETQDYSDLLNQLYSASQNLQIIFSDDPWAIKELIGGEIKYSKRICDSLKALKVMNTQNYMVWLMSLLDAKNMLYISPKWLSIAIKQVEVFSFRYFAVSKQPANRVEKLYAKLSRELFSLVSNNNKDGIEAQVLTKFKNIVKEDKLLPSDEQFIEDFSKIYLQTNNKAFIKYLLTIIEESNEAGEFMINQDIVNIEHILPQKPSREWQISDAELKESVNRLGNLTILLEKINSSMGNRPIKEKIESLKGSNLSLNKNIISTVEKNNYSWGPSEIGDRQLDLAHSAISIWKLQ